MTKQMRQIKQITPISPSVTLMLVLALLLLPAVLVAAQQPNDEIAGFNPNAPMVRMIYQNPATGSMTLATEATDDQAATYTLTLEGVADNDATAFLAYTPLTEGVSYSEFITDWRLADENEGINYGLQATLELGDVLLELLLTQPEYSADGERLTFMTTVVGRFVDLTPDEKAEIPENFEDASLTIGMDAAFDRAVFIASIERLENTRSGDICQTLSDRLTAEQYALSQGAPNAQDNIETLQVLLAQNGCDV